MNRRDLLRVGVIVAATLALPAASACKREVARCKHCGMTLDPASAWRADLVDEGGKTTSFCSPRCALKSWRSGDTAAKTILVQEYYERRTRDGRELQFVIGGDVPGPMGPDLVPVDPARSAKFVQDHGAERALSLDAVTSHVLATIGMRNDMHDK